MFNLVVFTWAYLFFGSGREEGYQAAMGCLLLFLVIRYLLFSISLFLALREFDGKGSVLPFLPFFRYYEFGALSGSTVAGMAALTASLVWFVSLATARGAFVFAVTSSLSLFTDLVCAVLFAVRAETGRIAPALLAASGLNFAAVLIVCLSDPD